MASTSAVDAVTAAKVKVAVRLKPLKADESAAWTVPAPTALMATDMAVSARETEPKLYNFGEPPHEPPRPCAFPHSLATAARAPVPPKGLL